MVSKTKLNITVFTSGFVLMVFEIVGSRVLAPFFGSSTVVWTSIIGVILAFMSLGYWYGGKMADKYHSIKTLATVLVIAALAMLVMNLTKNIIIKSIATLEWTLIVKSVISSIILFSIPSFLLAFVTPFAVRLEIHGVEDSGQTAGSIYAISTIGSIVGTFVSGFVFISLLGTNQIIWMLAAILFGLVAYIAPPVIKQNAVWSLILLAGNIYNTNARTRNYLDFDTEYARVFVYETEFFGSPVKIMSINGYLNSGMFVHNPYELVFDYCRYYDLITLFNPNWKNAVIFGGAAYSYPKHYMKAFPDKYLDVVEIDPGVTEIAINHFALEPNEKLNIIHQDARYFLQTANKKYDAVFFDLFTSPLNIPFHLTTVETFREVKSIMTDSSTLIINAIGDLEGYGSRFIRSELKTIQQVFPYTLLLYTPNGQQKGLRNFILIAMKHEPPNPLPDSGYYYDNFLQFKVDDIDLSDAMILTDNFAPVNHLIRTDDQDFDLLFTQE